MTLDVTEAAPLGPGHDLSAFRNGLHSELDTWFRERALASEGFSARTYVLCSKSHPTRVVGYHCISTALEQRSALPNARLRKGMPDQVPLLLIGRLAVDQDWRGRGLGSMLLQDALRRCIAASDIAGARAVIVHAIDATAAAFYVKHGFRPSPLGENVLFLPMETIRAAYA